MEESYHRASCVLRAHRKRRCCRYGSNSLNEIAPSHCPPRLYPEVITAGICKCRKEVQRSICAENSQLSISQMVQKLRFDSRPFTSGLTLTPDISLRRANAMCQNLTSLVGPLKAL